MKKILAIALAVAMVLTMASAFAWNWTCPTFADKTGKAKIEVIPYVKINNGCGGFDWVQSNCAGAVQTENIYFLVKLTIDKDINPIWFKYIADKVTLTFASGGFFTAKDVKSTADVVYTASMTSTLAPTSDSSSDGWVYYMQPVVKTDNIVTTTTLAAAQAWPAANEATENTLDATKFMFTAAVANASKAKVCAKFTSDFDGFDEWLAYGDYKILVTSTGTTKNTPYTITIIDACQATNAVDANDADTADITAGLNNVQSLQLTVDRTTGKIWQLGAEGMTSCSTDFANAALNYFGIQLGTCINKDNVRANFGWKDKVESCFTWSGNATAIVDVQCEVEIPKTGDVSVIAYAVMAVVAAAGAMGLKK